MPYRILFTSRDLLRCRFAISPLWETVGAVRALHDPRMQPFHLPWLWESRDTMTEAELAPLKALQPYRGWCPDFLSPTPGGPATTIEEELAGLRRVDPGVVSAELGRTLADQRDPAARALIAGMLEDAAAATQDLVDLIQRCWEVLVAPHWSRLRGLLEADITHHTRILAEGGLERLAPELDRKLSWRGDTLLVTLDHEERVRELNGTGLVLIPSAFNWPCTIVTMEVPDQPAIVYPVRGVGDLWRRPPVAPDVVGRLIGRSRALLLADLAEPVSTTVLAERHGLSPSTVSAHLGALREARLVGSRRHRHQVLYERTPLGSALIDGGL